MQQRYLSSKIQFHINMVYSSFIVLYILAWFIIEPTSLQSLEHQRKSATRKCSLLQSHYLYRVQSTRENQQNVNTVYHKANIFVEFRVLEKVSNTQIHFMFIIETTTLQSLEHQRKLASRKYSLSQRQHLCRVQSTRESQQHANTVYVYHRASNFKEFRALEKISIT